MNKSIKILVYCLTVGVVLAFTNLASACLTPPAGSNLAKGCYAESTVWREASTSVTIWQPTKQWRGDWQAGDEGKYAALLVFNKSGVSTAIAQWCTGACQGNGGKALNVPSVVIGSQLVVWLADPSKGNRHGDVGDVISIDKSTGDVQKLASQQSLLREPTFREVWTYNNCTYVMADAVFAATPTKTTVPQGYLLLSHPQPIALDVNCQNLQVVDSNRPLQLQRFRTLLGEERMAKSTRYLQLRDWSVINSKLHWLSKNSNWEVLE
jgi:hypothetical protein